MVSTYLLAFCAAVLFVEVCEAQLLGGIFNRERDHLICTICDNAKSWDECHEQMCQQDEDCQITVTEENSVKLINARCQNTKVNGCPQHHHQSGFGGFGRKRATTLCHTCCNSDNCNVDNCKHIEFKTPAQHHKVEKCKQCRLERFRWNCDHEDECHSNQVCFLQKLETVASFLGHRTYWHGGCIDTAKCDVVNVESFSDEHHLGEVEHGECCYRTNCNQFSLFDKHPTAQQTTVNVATQKFTNPQQQQTTTTTTTTTEQPTTTTTTSTTVPLTSDRAIDRTTMKVTGTTRDTTGALKCMSCKLDNFHWDCTNEETCSGNEVCFVQQLDPGSTVAFLNTEYVGGCVDPSKCSNLSTSSVFETNGLYDVTHSACCSTPKCNEQILQSYMQATTTQAPSTTTPIVTTTPPPVASCMQCIKQSAHWECSGIQNCTHNQVCYVQELKYNDVIPGLPPTYYHGACIDYTECSKIATTSLFREGGLAHVSRGECCHTDQCNQQLKYKYEGVDPPKPTVKPSTCEVCRGGRCGQAGFHGGSQLCDSATPYCMNHIDNDQSGAKNFEKRCASVQECDAVLAKKDSEKAVCSHFLQSISYTFPFQCSYCCTSDNCNSDTVPKTDLYMGTA